MRFFKRIGTAIAALAFMACPTSAGAVVIYDWSGEATTGFDGMATLTLTDAYMPGSALSLAHFVSFVYTNPGNAINVPTDIALLTISGTPPTVSGNALADVFLDFSDPEADFETRTDGSWEMWFNPASGLLDIGPTSAWTLRTVPEPAALAFLGLGLVGLGLVRRRRRVT